MTALFDKLDAARPNTVESHLLHAVRAFRERSTWRGVFRSLDGAYWSVLQSRVVPEEDFLSSRCDTVREVFGNPFRPTPRHRYPAHVVGLAAAAYSALPEASPDLLILQDALEEAGDDEAAAHLRQPGHVKGCHVLDRVLSR
jgi:hypothetical protein